MTSWGGSCSTGSGRCARGRDQAGARPLGMYVSPAHAGAVRAVRVRPGLVETGAVSPSPEEALRQQRAEAQRRHDARVWGAPPGARRSSSRVYRGWTPAARARWVRLCACVDWSPVAGGWFVTLTLPRGWEAYAPDGQAFARILARFWERWRRRWGQPVAVYAVEWQARGAPHVHAWVGAGYPARFAASLPLMWSESVSQTMSDGERRAHLAQGVYLERLNDRFEGSTAAFYASRHAPGLSKRGQGRPPASWLEPGRGLPRIYGARGVQRVDAQEVRLTEGEELRLRRLLRGWERSHRPRERVRVRRGSRWRTSHRRTRRWARSAVGGWAVGVPEAVVWRLVGLVLSERGG